MVFVDKLCISQTDEALKNEGIRGLAGFLNQARRLVILWSPRYFTRLWCVYEIASWLHLGKGLDSVSLVLMPVEMARGMCFSHAANVSYGIDKDGLRINECTQNMINPQPSVHTTRDCGDGRRAGWSPDGSP